MRRKSNPVPASSRLRAKATLRDNEREQYERAARLYADFSGHEPGPLARIPAPKAPRVALLVGHCDGVLYSTVRDSRKERYIHEFASKDRPLFAVSPDGKMLMLIGGNFKFTDRGIVDDSDIKNR